MQNSHLSNFDRTTVMISMVIVVALSAFFLTDTQRAVAIAGNIFTLIAYNLGTPFLWFGFAMVLISIYLFASKYGNIRMGDEKPEYTTFAYVTMMALAGVGSGTVYWAFLEWSYYIKTPPFAIEAGSTMAHEWAVTYSMHHWGITAWALYAISALPIMYSYYIRKNPSLKLSDIVKSMIKNETAGKIIGRVIDIAYPIAVVFGLIIVLALGVPIVSAAASQLFGITDGLILKIAMLAVVAALLILSSFVGLEKGMKNISSYGTYCLIALVVYILIFGPTLFILENTTSSISLWASNFIHMSLYTDAINQDKFPQNWTAYFWAYWIIYIPMMCIFITKVSKGRTIREVVACMLGGGTVGTGTLFAVVGSFMMKTQLDGKVNISQMVSDGQASQSIVAALNTLPLSSVILAVFIVSTFLLLVTTLDGSVFTVACQTQRVLDKNKNPTTWLKIFWCLIIIAIPAVFIIVDAPVGSMQSAVLIFTAPLVVLITYMLIKTFKYMSEDYSHLTAAEIRDMHKIAIDDRVVTQAETATQKPAIQA